MISPDPACFLHYRARRFLVGHKPGVNVSHIAMDLGTQTLVVPRGCQQSPSVPQNAMSLLWASRAHLLAWCMSFCAPASPW